MKLSNFLSADVERPGAGLGNLGRLDRELWDEFKGKRDALQAEADRIRKRYAARESR